MQKTSRIKVDKNKSSDYTSVADNFTEGAELAKEFGYWNAAGVLIVHAAIAYTDAITIKVAGVKSRGEDHAQAARLMEEVVALDEDGRKALNKLRRLIEEKNLVSYSGEIYQKNDIERMWKLLERYKNWAVEMLGL